MIHRDIHTSYTDVLTRSDILCIEGFYSTGKSTTLKHISKQLSTPTDTTLLLSAKNTRWKTIWHDEATFLQFIISHSHKNTTHLYICIDDIDILPHPTMFLLNIWHLLKKNRNLSYHVTFIVTSSQRLFSQSSVDALRRTEGEPRIILYPLYPLSWQEILCSYDTNFINTRDQNTLFEDFSIYEYIYNSISNFHGVKELFEQYLLFGGFPAVIQSPQTQSSTQLLQHIVYSYFDTVLLPEVAKKSTDECFHIFTSLIEFIGEPTKRKKIFASANLSLTDGNNCLLYLKKTLLLNFVSPYFTDTRYEMTKRKTPYLIDHGIMQYMPAAPLGYNYRQLTNMLYNEVYRSHIFEHIFSYRTTIGKDLLMVARMGTKLVPIDLRISDRSPRPHSSLKTFLKKYNNVVSHTIVLTNNILKKEDTIWYIPFMLFPLLLQHSKSPTLEESIL